MENGKQNSHTSFRRVHFFCLSIFAVFIFNLCKAQVEIPGAPLGSYTDYFRYYDPADATLPPGAAAVSGATVGMSVIANYLFDQRMGGATGFFIRTFRSDNKICYCTAGHTINNYFDPLPTPASIYYFTGYMNHLGRESALRPGYNENISGAKGPMHGTVLQSTYNNQSITNGDGALLLIDKANIPVDTYTELGYDLSYIPQTNDSTFVIGHPIRMPQRIANPVIYNATQVNYISFKRLTGNNRMSVGASGSPTVKYSLKDNSFSVIGMLTNGIVTAIPTAVSSITDGQRILYYDDYIFASKIDVLATNIKKYCWQTKTERDLMVSGEYKTSIQIDNNFGIHQYAKVITFNTEFNFIDVKDQGYSNDNPGSILLKGSTISMACNITPVANTDTIYCVASKEIILNPGFSYTPSKPSNMLDLDVVILAAPSSSFSKSGISISPTSDDGISAGKQVNKNAYSVFPSPSNGIININTDNNSKQYTIRILNINGQVVFEDKVAKAGNKKLNITTNTANGLYILQVIEVGDTKIKTWKIIVGK